MTGFKVFTTGAVLTASEMNGYLMAQVVIICTSATRPSSPVAGMRIYETDTDSDMRYSGSAWAPLSIPRYAYKTTDQAVATSTTLVDTTDLSLSLLGPSGSVYAIDAAIQYSADGAGDLKYGWSFPASAQMKFGHAGVYDTVGAFTSNAQYSESTTVSVGGVGAGIPNMLRIAGRLIMSSTTGTLKFRFAQNSSVATGTTIFAGSWMSIVRVA